MKNVYYYEKNIYYYELNFYSNDASDDQHRSYCIKTEITPKTMTNEIATKCLFGSSIDTQCDDLIKNLVSVNKIPEITANEKYDMYLYTKRIDTIYGACYAKPETQVESPVYKMTPCEIMTCMDPDYKDGLMRLLVSDMIYDHVKTRLHLTHKELEFEDENEREALIEDVVNDLVYNGKFDYNVPYWVNIDRTIEHAISTPIQYWVSFIMTDNNSNTVSIGLSNSFSTIEAAKRAITKQRENYTVLSAWIDEVRGYSAKTTVFHECYVNAIGSIEK